MERLELGAAVKRIEGETKRIAWGLTSTRVPARWRRRWRVRIGGGKLEREKKYFLSISLFARRNWEFSPQIIGLRTTEQWWVTLFGGLMCHQLVGPERQVR